MKSKMPAYNDEVGSSLQKMRGILQQRGMLNGFSSSIRDDNTRALSEEIINFISARLEEYLSENSSETIDQVSGRIQAKLDSLDESGVSVSDEAVDKVKEALAGFKFGSSIVQDITGILNSIGSKVNALKDFLCGGSEEKKKKKDKKKANSLIKSLMKDKDLFIKFIDEVMPQVTYFETRLAALETYMQTKAEYFSDIVGKKTIASVMALALARAAEAASTAALNSSNFTLALANIQLSAANFALSAAELALSAAKLLLTASDILLMTARTTLMVSAATFMVGVLASVMTGTVVFIASIMAASAAAIVGLLAAVVIVVSSLAAAAAAVITASAVVITTVFSASAAVVGAFLSSVATVAAVAASFTAALFGSAFSVSMAAVSVALSMMIGAVVIAAQIIAAAIAVLAVAALSSIMVIAVAAIAAAAVAAAALVAGAFAAGAVIIAGAAVAFAVLAAAALIAGVVLATALAVAAVAAVIAFSALAVIAVAGIVLVAAAAFAAGLVVSVAAMTAALTLGTAAVCASLILLATAGFTLALAVAIAVVIAAIAAAALLMFNAAAALAGVILVLTLLALALPILLIFGIQWLLDKIKDNIYRLDPVFDAIDGWMNVFRSDEDKTSGDTFGVWFEKKLSLAAGKMYKWVQGWPVWKWLADARDWISSQAKRIATAISSYLTVVKNAFIVWWNDLMDTVASAGKFTIFEHDFDLFSGAASMKIGLDQPPSVPASPSPPSDEQAVLSDISPEEIADGIQARSADVQDAVKQYGNERRAAVEKEDAAKAGAMDASGAEVDAELDALLDEASAGPDVSTPPVPVKTRSAGMSLEEQEG